jgi:hypothetical protein
VKEILLLTQDDDFGEVQYQNGNWDSVRFILKPIFSYLLPISFVDRYKKIITSLLKKIIWNYRPLCGSH